MSETNEMTPAMLRVPSDAAMALGMACAAGRRFISIDVGRRPSEGCAAQFRRDGDGTLVLESLRRWP